MDKDKMTTAVDATDERKDTEKATDEVTASDVSSAAAAVAAAAAMDNDKRDITSPTFTIHRLLTAHEFLLTDIVHFLDVRSTVRFLALFSVRKRKKKGAIVNPRFVPSSAFLQRLLQQALWRTSIGHICSFDLVHRLNLGSTKMMQLSTLSAIFRGVARLKDEKKGPYTVSSSSPADSTPAISSNPVMEVVVVRRKRAPDVTLKLPYKSCCFFESFGTVIVGFSGHCGRRVLWDCHCCGELCNECRDHCATCERCGANVCQDCISDDGDLCWSCFEEVDDEASYNGEDDDEDDEDDGVFECEFCGITKPVEERISDDGCEGCSMDPDGACCLECAAMLFNLHECRNCFAVSCESCALVQVCGHCDTYFCSAELSTCPGCGELCCSGCNTVSVSAAEGTGEEGAGTGEVKEDEGKSKEGDGEGKEGEGKKGEGTEGDKKDGNVSKGGEGEGEGEGGDDVVIGPLD